MQGEHDHYRVETTSDGVVAWSTKPISFGPKDWSNDLRRELLDGLRALGATPRWLAGEVWDAVGRVLDLENAVMYNIGLREFTPFMGDGLWFRRHTLAFLPERQLAGGPVTAEYRYSAVDVATPLPASSDRVAFAFQARRPSDVKATWLAARKAVAQLEGSVDLTGSRLGLRVTGPHSLGTAAVKPLLDGIVSALHVMSADDVLTVPTMTGWGLEDAERLVTSGAAPLGPRPLIVMQGPDRPAWNPADDVFDEILVTSSALDDRCEVEVYRLP